jgi:endonuclease YncB( thermonuclease family)
MNGAHLSLPTLLVLLGAMLASCACVPVPQAPGSPSQASSVSVPPAPAIQPGDRQPLLHGAVTEVIDGDTIRVQLDSGPITVRFHSIDAPERSQPWGVEAKAALSRFVGRRQVALEVIEQDQYDRLVAVVHVGDENLNAWMVQQGYAWAYRRYMQDAAYCTWEASARLTRRGLWSQAPYDWKAPWEFRQAQRTGSNRFSDYSRETEATCAAAMRKAGWRPPR